MQSTGSTAPVTVSPQSLAAAFADVPDPRRAASVRDPLAAILTLAVSAILANHRSVLAIAEWGARQSPEHLRTLGVDDGRTPCQSTVQRLFRHLDGAALAQTLTHCFTACVTSPAAEAGPQGIAIDGKAQRGRLRFAGGPVHALRAFCHEQGIVLAHEPIIATAAKAEAELTVAPTLLDRLDWHGRVLTGDALFCQRARCQQVHDVGGDYLLLVKENQPDLHEAIALLFDPPPVLARRPRDGLRITRTIDTGHGRRPEIRELQASTDLTTYLEWPAEAGAALRDHQSLPGGGDPRPADAAQAWALGDRNPAPLAQGCHLWRRCQPDPRRPGADRDGAPAGRRRQPAASPRRAPGRRPTPCPQPAPGRRDRLRGRPPVH